MASKVQICNMALTRLATSRIIDINDNTAESKDCSFIFDLVVEEVSSMGEWPSARKRALLAQLADTPPFGYSYYYQLPSDCLRITHVNEVKVGSIPFVVEGDRLLCDDASVGIRYLSAPTDISKIDIYLRQAIVDRLVADLIYKKTANLTAYKASLEYHQTHARQLLVESNVNATSAIDINSDTFIDARNGCVDESKLRGV